MKEFVAIQINGRLIDTIEVDVRTEKDALAEIARNNDKVKARLSGKKVARVISIQNWLVNFITDDHSSVKNKDN